MTSFDGNNQISCHGAQLLMSPYMEDDPALTQEDREASEQQRKLAALVAQLTPALPDQREGQGQ